MSRQVKIQVVGEKVLVIPKGMIVTEEKPPVLPWVYYLRKGALSSKFHPLKDLSYEGSNVIEGRKSEVKMVPFSLKPPG